MAQGPVDENLDVAAAADRVSDDGIQKELRDAAWSWVQEGDPIGAGLAEDAADRIAQLSRDLHVATDRYTAGEMALEAALNLVEAQATLLHLLNNRPELGVDDELSALRRQLNEARLREDARPLALAPDAEDMAAIDEAYGPQPETEDRYIPNPRADRLHEEMRAVQAALQTVLGGVGLWRDSALKGGLKRVLRALDAVLTRDEKEAGL
jgi:hypothetical protein